MMGDSPKDGDVRDITGSRQVYRILSDLDRIDCMAEAVRLVCAAGAPPAVTNVVHWELSSMVERQSKGELGEHGSWVDQPEIRKTKPRKS